MLYFSRKVAPSEAAPNQRENNPAPEFYQRMCNMIKAAKIAISLPKADLKRIEEIRKESGIKRSALIDEAIRFWLNNRDKNKENWKIKHKINVIVWKYKRNRNRKKRIHR